MRSQWQKVTIPLLYGSPSAFSMVKVHEGGQLAHLKGQVSLELDGQVVGKGDMRAQVRQTLENIEAVLKSIGGEMSDIVSLTQ
jgi:2-iminobutanoate/2-iminopropanoate deaminase